jgi:hypothetical protein
LFGEPTSPPGILSSLGIRRREQPMSSHTDPEVTSRRAGHPLDGPPGESGAPYAPQPSPLRKIPGREPRTDVESRPDPGSAVFPAQLFGSPNHVFVYGPSRALVNLTIFALASNTNPEFHWVEIGSRNEPRTPCDPVQLGWIPADRLWLVDAPEALRPNDAALRASLSDVIRPDEPVDSLRQFTEFLRLPDGSQRIIASQVPNGHPGVVVVTNAHRADCVFSADQVPSILEVHRNAGFSVMVGYGDAPGPQRDLFDFVFRIEGEDKVPQDWKTNQLVCEKGIFSGPLRDLRAVPLPEIPILAEVVSRARPL